MWSSRLWLPLMLLEIVTPGGEVESRRKMDGIEKLRAHGWMIPVNPERHSSAMPPGRVNGCRPPPAIFVGFQNWASPILAVHREPRFDLTWHLISSHLTLTLTWGQQRLAFFSPPTRSISRRGRMRRSELQ